jgi:hypothetical protein
MTSSPNFYAQARAEIIALFGWNADGLSPDQTLRVDCAVALRLALDDLQGRIVRGESIDVTRMLNASEALSRLLPPTALATPPSEQRADPRQVMWEIYKTMRERGELTLKETGGEELLQAKINEQAAQIERLKAQLAGGLAPALLDVPTSDVVPPGERAECDAGPRVGLDDPKPRRPGPVIEGRVVRKPPAASAAPPSRQPTWDDTPNGKAWQAWHDAGGNGGGDPWANNNR